MPVPSSGKRGSNPHAHLHKSVPKKIVSGGTTLRKKITRRIPIPGRNSK